MSKLIRARTRLIELRKAADPGPWYVSNEQTWSQAEIKGEYGAIAGPGDFASSDATFGKETAHLIVTLYSTIDAQVALLDHAIVSKKNHDSRRRDYRSYLGKWSDTETGSHMYALADAILGENKWPW